MGEGEGRCSLCVRARVASSLICRNNSKSESCRSLRLASLSASPNMSNSLVHAAFNRSLTSGGSVRVGEGASGRGAPQEKGTAMIEAEENTSGYGVGKEGVVTSQRRRGDGEDCGDDM